MAAKNRKKTALKRLRAKPRIAQIQSPQLPVETVPGTASEAPETTGQTATINLLDVIKRAYAIFRSHFWKLFLPALIMSIPAVLFYKVDLKDLKSLDYGYIFSVICLMGAVAPFFTAVMFKIADSGGRMVPTELVRFGLGRYLPWIGTGAVNFLILAAIFSPAIFLWFGLKSGLLALLSLLPIFVLLYYVLILFTFIWAVVCLEPDEPNPFKTSAAIVKGSFWTVFLGVILLAIGSQVLRMVFSPFAYILSGITGSISQFGAEMIISIIYTPVFTVFYTAFIYSMYRSLKEIKTKTITA